VGLFPRGGAGPSEPAHPGCVCFLGQAPPASFLGGPGGVGFWGTGPPSTQWGGRRAKGPPETGLGIHCFFVSRWAGQKGREKKKGPPTGLWKHRGAGFSEQKPPPWFVVFCSGPFFGGGPGGDLFSSFVPPRVVFKLAGHKSVFAGSAGGDSGQARAKAEWKFAPLWGNRSPRAPDSGAVCFGGRANGPKGTLVGASPEFSEKTNPFFPARTGKLFPFQLRVRKRWEKRGFGLYAQPRHYQANSFLPVLGGEPGFKKRGAWKEWVLVFGLGGGPLGQKFRGGGGNVFRTRGAVCGQGAVGVFFLFRVMGG